MCLGSPGRTQVLIHEVQVLDSTCFILCMGETGEMMSQLGNTSVSPEELEEELICWTWMFFCFGKSGDKNKHNHPIWEKSISFVLSALT